MWDKLRPVKLLDLEAHQNDLRKVLKDLNQFYMPVLPAPARAEVTKLKVLQTVLPVVIFRDSRWHLFEIPCSQPVMMIDGAQKWVLVLFPFMSTCLTCFVAMMDSDSLC